MSLAGSFQNLDFDGALTNKANLVASPAGYSWGNGSASDLLPAWILTHGGEIVSNMTFNYLAPDVDSNALYDLNGTEETLHFPYPPDGCFALYLGFTHSQSYELTQSGELPTN